MNTTLSNEYDTQTNRIIGFNSVYTTLSHMPAGHSSSGSRLGVHTSDCALYSRGVGSQNWVQQVVWYGADDAGGFELIPSVQEKGYYGARKVEKRPSAPTVSVVLLKSEPVPREARGEPVKYLAEVVKYATAVAHAHDELVANAARPMPVSVIVNNLAIRPVDHKDKWEKRLDDLQTFERDWDSYGAEPPSQQSIGNARAFVAFLRTNFKEPDALNPSAVGGVGFTFRDGKRSVYIEFRNTGNAHAAFMGAGKPRVEKVIQDADGFRAVMHQTETHLYEQDAATARIDETSRPSRY
ncbi:hypothetical protein GobsT_12030 [Gemmata obscuriglobus]|uniref:Uncharacterized protein n=1 Tax=Gemmata obscuriglobus TaxID=114 RepID=A0A2Z3HBH9_9BACT|nr:hypothetical protein [Gemmata obscuriglobus]AWM40325.1 hypothetical protein C1280_27185 [Gemmata obscuriglobus]QEG26464.1 hypothetical protein GobsT_12030 [Gemmata obscuriglobus]VTS01680.1 unnamed protein product [Gemmata obscuriglobus UQM 2246]